MANLHSKIVTSPLVAVADLSAVDLTGALLHAYDQRTSSHARQVQMLELLLKLARDHPQGTVLLRERCVLELIHAGICPARSRRVVLLC